jgi:hypothetical protein
MISRAHDENEEDEEDDGEEEETIGHQRTGRVAVSPKTAPYGSWKSPITSDLIAAQAISLSEPRLNGEQVYWLEGRPQELGRYVVVRASSRGGHDTDMTRNRTTRARASTSTVALPGRSPTVPSTSPTSLMDAFTARGTVLCTRHC